MKRNVLIFAALALLAAIALAAYVLRDPEAASAPIAAVPLEVEAASPPAEAEAPAEPAAETPPEPAAFVPEGIVVFVIAQDASEARFSIDEILNGSPTTAIGVTDQVAGEIAIDFANPANTRVGVITINARTLATDRENRNRMIRNEILDTAEFEFITFTPTAITGLPAAIIPGETVTFLITGDLTIRAITVQQTFQITATVGADGRLSGYGVATVLRSDYDLIIPSVPSVADVSDEVILEIEFVALPK
jgi:polyisoprenoid-binding protein YceI